MLLEALQFAVGAARSAIFTHASAEPPGKSLNWGTKILWHTTLKEAEEVSAKTNKPVMVIIYHEYCPSCKMIIPRLTQDDQIVELSKNFTVVALHDTKALDSMKVDGGYIPRIYFMSPHGEILVVEGSTYLIVESDATSKPITGGEYSRCKEIITRTLSWPDDVFTSKGLASCTRLANYVMNKYYNIYGNPKFKYFYNNEETLVKIMKQVMEDFGDAKDKKKKK